MALPRHILRFPLNAMRSRSSSSTSSSTATKPPSLPRLPVPDLRKTLDKYLTSIEPFLRETEHSTQAFSAAYHLRKQWADEFCSGIGTVLQERLIGARHVRTAHTIKLTTTGSTGQGFTKQLAR